MKTIGSFALLERLSRCWSGSGSPDLPGDFSMLLVARRVKPLALGTMISLAASVNRWRRPATGNTDSRRKPSRI